MTRYRNTLYKKYFSTQLGRKHLNNDAQKFTFEAAHFGREIIPLLPQNKEIKILDIGCGTGSFIHACKNGGYQNIIGIDISPEMVEVAHKNGISEAFHGDLKEWLQNENNKYDLITGMDIIEHFTKDELTDLMGLIQKSLQKNGCVIFRTPNGDAPFSGIYTYGDFTHENILNQNSATQLLMSVGFENVAVFPSRLHTDGFLKEWFRKITWKCITYWYKIQLFASARSTNSCVFTPNMIIKGNL